MKLILVVFDTNSTRADLVIFNFSFEGLEEDVKDLKRGECDTIPISHRVEKRMNDVRALLNSNHIFNSSLIISLPPKFRQYIHLLYK